MTKVFVGNLPFNTGEDDVRELFEQYCKVSSVHLVKDVNMGESRGFGFVEVDDWAKAVKKLDDFEYHGRAIIVKKARERGNWK